MKSQSIVKLAIFLMLISLMCIVVSAEGETNATSNETNIVTKQDALLAINQSEQIIQEMIKHDFSILYMNDTLLETKRVYEQAKYAEILRDVNSTEAEKSESRKALSLVKWERY